MHEPTDPPPRRQTTDTEPCPCGSTDHKPLKVGEKLSPSGGSIGPVYVCPARATAGLRSVL